MEERLALLALHFIPGIGNHLIRQLYSFCGSATQVFKTPKGKLRRIPGIGKVTSEAIHKSHCRAKAEKEWEACSKLGIRLQFFLDPDYPRRLLQIPDAPTLLYHRGPVQADAEKVIAIVGTRRATEYGKQCVEHLIADLVTLQPLIVSGLAFGIDVHAHRMALHHQLPTIAVIATGVDRVYPPLHHRVTQELIAEGALISEWPMGTTPETHHFPARNRIIAGLSDAVVVVEASSNGGALITAHLANDYNREVFAFPGSIYQPFSEGCNELIRTQRSHLIRSARDLVEVMNWDQGQPSAPVSSFSLELTPSQQQIFRALQERSGQATLDEIAWTSCLPIGQVLPLLFELELLGILKALPGNVFRLSN